MQRRGKAIVQQQGNAYVFASPAIAGDVVLVGVTNGTLETRDLETGALLWEYQTDASKRNNGWVLTSGRQFNSSLLFRSNWREDPIASNVRQNSVGSIFSSPLVVNGVVYFGSTDGNLYALD